MKLSHNKDILLETAFSDIIIRGDATEIAGMLYDESIHTIVTSPPYYGLRNYGKKGQLGLEKTPEEYIEKLVGVFRALKPKLRDDGTVWVNIADSYWGSNGNGYKQTVESTKTFEGKAGIEKYRRGGGIQPLKPIRQKRSRNDIKNKDLILIPFEFAKAMRADGWYLRSDIIWLKPNTMPESVLDRPTKAHEYIFLFSKKDKYYYDNEAIREIAKYDGRKNINSSGAKKYIASNGEYSGDSLQGLHKAGRPRWITNENGTFMRNKRTVWEVPTKPYSGEHFAAFPEKLIEPCILAGCPENGLVYDPFMGSGTTAAVCQKNNRHFLGSELNERYIQLAYNRLNNK